MTDIPPLSPGEEAALEQLTQPPRPISEYDGLPLTITAVLATVDLTVGDLRHSGPGRVIPLLKTIAEPIDLLVNGALVARGELVTVDDRHYGVRLTEIIPLRKGGATP